MNDLRLIEIVRSAEVDVDWPESPHLAQKVSGRLQDPRRRLRWLVPVATLLLVVALFPPTRQAVGDVLTRAGVTIGFGDPASVELNELDLGDAVGLDDVDPDLLGPVARGVGRARWCLHSG